MPALKSKIIGRKFTFNRGGFTKALDAKLDRSMILAARAWLEAVLKQVPVWSGQAAGSAKLATGRSGPSSGLFLYQFVKAQLPPLSPLHSRRNKNPSTGGAQGRYTFSSSRNQYRFTFQSDVIYFVIQDFYNIGVSPSAPWGALEAGAAAFSKSLRSVNLPTVKDFTLSVDITNE